MIWRDAINSDEFVARNFPGLISPLGLVVLRLEKLRLALLHAEHRRDSAQGQIVSIGKEMAQLERERAKLEEEKELGG